MHFTHKLWQISWWAIVVAGTLTACSTHTGPDGARIYGPQVERSLSTSFVMPTHTTLTYSVTGFQPASKGSMDYLQGLGREAVVDDDRNDEYDVIFTDNSLGQPILQMHFTTESDNFMSAITVLPGFVIYCEGCEH
jgi:hypothetical protein